MVWISRIGLKCLQLIKCMPPSLITDHTLVTLAIAAYGSQKSLGLSPPKAVQLERTSFVTASFKEGSL